MKKQNVQEGGYMDSFNVIMFRKSYDAGTLYLTMQTNYMHSFSDGFLRMLADNDRVVVSAGLPLVHTTPGQTPQFDIAGQGIANEQQLRDAIYLAIDIFRHRAEYDEPLSNPLKKLYHEKRDDSEKVRFTIPKKHDQNA